MKLRGVVAVTSLLVGVAQGPVSVNVGAAQAQSPAVPRPFPNSGASKPAESTPSPASPAPTAPATPEFSVPPPPSTQAGRPLSSAEAPPGTPVHPTAEFIDSYDAGAGQRYYLYGTNAPYGDIVTYYRNLLKNGGRELFRVPPTQQFDLGRFDSGTMAYPPSVVVKDYTWNSSPGYLAVSGTTEKRFKTIIQVVPPTTVR